MINWENDGYEIKNAGNSGLQGKQMYFHEFASASKIGTGRRPFRYYEKNILFDSDVLILYAFISEKKYELGH